MNIQSTYFDGKTSRPHSVVLTVQDGMAILQGDVERRCAIVDLRVSERNVKAPRKITFPDEAYLEVKDGAAFQELLARTGYRDSKVVSWQQSWSAVVVASIFTVAVLVIGYLYLLPVASNIAARAIPDKAIQVIGRESLSVLDQHSFLPTELTRERRDALANRFNALQRPEGSAQRGEIIFRKSRVGPNAFALPSGQIVLTDELVRLAKTDDAIMGVLAHELGHLHERHLLRRLLQSAAIAAGAFAILGDVSATVANLPPILLDLKYSRDAEREADAYASAMLRANGIDATALAELFSEIEALSPRELPPYLSSHPASAERRAELRRNER